MLVKYINFNLLCRTEFLTIREKNVIFHSRAKAFYLFISQSTQSVYARLLTLAKFNNRVKIVQIYYNISHKECADFLVLIWTEHKIMNTVMYRIFHDNEGNETHLEAIIFNPFTIRNNERGTISTLKLPQDSNKIKLFWKKFNERLDNVHGYPLHVCIFEYAGASMAVLGKNDSIIKYKLRDGNLISALMKAMNFNPIYYVPSDGKTYGGALENGTLTGAIWEMEYGPADILGNIRPIKNYGLTKAQFLLPADEMKLTFLVPKMQEGTVVSFLRIFTRTAWLALCGTFLCTTLAWYSLQNIYVIIKCHFRKINELEMIIRRNIISLEEIVYLLFGVVLQVSQKSRQKMYERCLFMSMVFFSMIISYTYQGT